MPRRGGFLGALDISHNLEAMMDFLLKAPIGRMFDDVGTYQVSAHSWKLPCMPGEL